MIWIDLILYGILFIGTIPIWIFIYKHYLGSILADIYVQKIESGQIDLNYLLEEGGVFDNLSERIVIRFKQNMLAEMGQLSNQQKSVTPDLNDQVGQGIEMAGELLKMVGMKNLQLCYNTR